MNFSFRTRVLGTVTLACMICTIAAVMVARARLSAEMEEGLARKSRAILSR